MDPHLDSFLASMAGMKLKGPQGRSRWYNADWVLGLEAGGPAQPERSKDQKGPLATLHQVEVGEIEPLLQTGHRAQACLETQPEVQCQDGPCV